MANTIQDEIYQSFLSVSQQQSGELAQEKQSLSDLIVQADQVRQDMAQQYVRTTVTGRGSSGSSSGGTGGNSALGSVLDVFKSGLGLSPIVQGIMSIFGGGDSSTPAPLVKYALPPAVNFQAAEVGGQVMNLDYDQAGMPRYYGATQAASGVDTGTAAPQIAGGGGQVGGGGSQVAPSPQRTAGAPGGGSASQITVNVQAMDARSFMDRSSDIALAVREAMLNLNAINDVVNDL